MKKRVEIEKALLQEGKTKEEIIQQLQISERTFYNYRKTLDIKRITHNKIKIDFKRYFDVVLKGNFANKRDMAKALNVSHTTLIKYEQGGAMAKVARYLYLNNYSIREIADKLHAEYNTVENMVWDVLPFKSLKNGLETAISILSPFAEFDYTIIAKITKLQKKSNCYKKCLFTYKLLFWFFAVAFTQNAFFALFVRPFVTPFVTPFVFFYTFSFKLLKINLLKVLI